MKRALGITLASIFFLILLALLLFKLFFSAPQSTTTPVAQTANPFAGTVSQSQTIYTDSPYRTATTCYAWYVTVSDRGANASLISSRPEAAQCFTAAFIQNWPDIIDHTGSDPVLIAQDTGATWLKSITATTAATSVRSSDQHVVLGTATEQHDLIAHIVQNQSGQWQIDSVSLP